MPQTFKIKTSQSYIGTGIVFWHIDKEGDKHEIIICAKDRYALSTMLKDAALMVEPIESKFQLIQITKAL
jgi:hypothetical protein